MERILGSPSTGLGTPKLGTYASPGHTVQDEVFKFIRQDASDLLTMITKMAGRKPNTVEKISMDKLMGELKKRVDMINKPDFRRVGTGGNWKAQVNSAWTDLQTTYADCTQNHRDYRRCLQFVEALRDLMG